jgi:hypothetical protein
MFLWIGVAGVAWDSQVTKPNRIALADLWPRSLWRSEQRLSP